MKKVIWAGCAFNDYYYIMTPNGFKYETEEGGIKNCIISSVENCYDFRGWDDAKFVINSHGIESDVSFKYSKKFSEFDIFGKADWLHIAYIDALPMLDLTKIDRERFGKISCDFCHKYPNPDKQRIYDNVKCCDVIFNNWGKHNPNYYDSTNNQIHVIHSPNGSLVIQGQRSSQKFLSERDYLFTVSAGDRLAAAFIESQMRGDDIVVSQEFAHEKVEKWLQNVNKNF